MICSHIFWIGDLNYRIIDNPPRHVFDTTDFTSIIKLDQLYTEMQKRRVFQNYTEGPITFRPTYKYDPGTDEWDSRYFFTYNLNSLLLKAICSICCNIEHYIPFAVRKIENCAHFGALWSAFSQFSVPIFKRLSNEFIQYLL